MPLVPFNPGDRFDRYIIATLLGRGGMGAVYRAQDTRLQRPVALKMMTGDGSSGEESRLGTDGAARLLREARAVASLDHPNAIAIFDVGEHEGVPYLAMEFIAGRTLRQLGHDPSISLDRRLRWLVDAARGLGAAHRRGIVHRDVKPENVMVREDGIVKVLDFGIARAAKVDPTAAMEAGILETLTANWLVVGTPLYMAPEQMRGENADGRADQFAWGVMAYELLTGALPWRTDGTPLQILSNVLSQVPTPLRARDPAITQEVEACILRALAMAPGARFETMEHLIACLEPFAAPLSLLPAPLAAGASPARAAQESTRTQLAAEPIARRRISALWIGATGALLVGAALVVAFRGPHLAAHAAPPPPAPLDAASAPHTAWTDTGSQTSANVEAQSAYVSGMQAMRDASLDRARHDLEQATALDPTFAAAHLRAALASEALDTPMHAHLQKALQLRQALSEHDHRLLDAVEPWARVPADLDESSRRLRAILATEPGDADGRFLLGATRAWMQDHRGAIEAFDGVLRVDPALAIAHGAKAREELAAGDASAAARSDDACLEMSPAATSCVVDRYAAVAREGKCDAMEALARRLIGIDAQAPGGYERLAEALHARGQPEESVRTALGQSWQRTPEAQRAVARERGQVALDLARGDFTAASEGLARWESLVATSPDEGDHLEPARLQMLVALETARPRDAVKIADGYDQPRAAWPPDDLRDAPTIYTLQARVRALAIPHGAVVATRAKWLAGEEERGTRFAQSGGRTACARGSSRTRRSRGRRATRRRRSRRCPGTRRLEARARTTPRTTRSAGRSSSRGGSTTRSSSWGAPRDRASGWKTRSRTRKRSSTWARSARRRRTPRGACAAYAKVVATWASARPRSVTLDAARARSSALRCPPR